MCRHARVHVCACASLLSVRVSLYVCLSACVCPTISLIIEVSSPVMWVLVVTL